MPKGPTPSFLKPHQQKTQPQKPNPVPGAQKPNPVPQPQNPTSKPTINEQKWEEIIKIKAGRNTAPFFLQTIYLLCVYSHYCTNIANW